MITSLISAVAGIVLQVIYVPFALLNQILSLFNTTFGI